MYYILVFPDMQLCVDLAWINISLPRKVVKHYARITPETAERHLTKSHHGCMSIFESECEFITFCILNKEQLLEVHNERPWVYVNVWPPLSSQIILGAFGYIYKKNTEDAFFNLFCDVFKMIPVEQLGCQQRSDFDVCNAAWGETKQNLQKGER